MALLLAGSVSAQTTFYVSPDGNDAADGLTPATAWRTVDKVSATAFQPGQTVLFQRGGEWRGRLSAAASGTPEAPIVYGAYGSGPRPRFYGSDVLEKSAFTPIALGSTVSQVAAPDQVGSVLADGVFFRSSELVTKSADPAVNRSWVAANANSWWWDSEAKRLLVNTGGDISTDPRRVTAVTRDDVVFNNFKSNLVFRDLAADETAFYGRGYAFRVQSGDNVRIEDSEAHRAGKHHFGVINSTGFVGKGLYATLSMPDQGVGGATALVSYSDNRYSGQTSVWEDVLVENAGSEYPAWYSHGEGIGQITLRNIVAKDTSIILKELTTAYNLTTINGGISAAAGAVLDGATMQGNNASLTLGADASARNILIDKYRYVSSYASPIVITGANTSLEFATVTTHPSNPAWGSLITFTQPGANLDLHGTILATPGSAFSYSLTSLDQITSDYNLMANLSFRLPGSGVNITLAQWAAATGNDLNSLLGMPVFVDPLTGNYNLVPQSLGIDVIPAGLFPEVLFDRNGRPRLIGGGYDIGALEGFAVVPEPSALVLPLAAGTALLGRRRTGRKLGV